MKIVPYTAARFDEVVQFVTRLNADGAHHIGYFGIDPADIAYSIRAADPPPEAGYRLVDAAERLVGLLGIETDLTLGRTWLYGPLIEHADWQALAGRLYADVQPAIRAGVIEHELFCDVRNANVRAFAERYAFPLHSEAAILNFQRARLAALPFASAPDLDGRLYAQFDALHQDLFPRTYASAEQLIARRGGDARILMAAAGDRLIGYACVKVEPAAGQGYIDYIGVAEDARGRGVATHLMSAALHWIFARSEVRHADLTVNADNHPALRLYARLGFTTERTMCAYRKRVA